MSCCGKKREQIAHARSFAIQPRPAPQSMGPARTTVVFKGVDSYLVTGPVSGTVYRFSSRAPEQSIDARDAAALIRTRLFEPGN